MATILYAERQYEGAEHLRCEAIWTNGFCVLSISYRYDHDPVFRPRLRKEPTDPEIGGCPGLAG